MTETTARGLEVFAELMGEERAEGMKAGWTERQGLSAAVVTEALTGL